MKAVSENVAVDGCGLFRGLDGRNVLVTFVLVTALFLLWGFCNGMIDILNKHFQDSLHINKQQSGLVQFANHLGYFLLAIPAGLIATKIRLQGWHSGRVGVDCQKSQRTRNFRDLRTETICST